MPQNPLADKIKTQQQVLLSLWKMIDLDTKQKKLKNLSKEMAQTDFWQQERQQTQAVAQEVAHLKSFINPYLELKQELDNLATLTQEEGSQSALQELETLFDDWQKKLEKLKHQLRFQGEYDNHAVILSIFAGAGGADAQDWVAMLLRMYERWADGHKIKIEVVSQSVGEIAGLKSVSLHLFGKPFLYGRLKGEQGVHRLIRLSPFNAQNLRQTSFAQVEIMPVLEDMDFQLNENELQFDFFKSGGAGGQSVNKTDSAVRVSHLPTGLTVTIQNERSQLQNRQMALKILGARLKQREEVARRETEAQFKAHKKANEWGNQIRNYVLHPYKQVKDLRTQLTINDPQKVLDGDLDDLIEAYLEQES